MRHKPLCDKIADLLAEGFGSEDIALKLGVLSAAVEFQLSKMRRTGRLDQIYSDARKVWAC